MMKFAICRDLIVYHDIDGLVNCLCRYIFMSIDSKNATGLFMFIKITIEDNENADNSILSI